MAVFECRTDNGRAFLRGGFEYAARMGVLQFHDGRIIRFGPMSHDYWIDFFKLDPQPGCAWNSRWRDKPPTHWEYLSEWPKFLLDQFEANPDGTGYRPI